MPKVFLSYRRDDSATITGRIYDRLVREVGREKVFKDVDSIAPGGDFVEELDRALAASDVFLALIGPRWLDAGSASGQRRLEHPSDFVRREIEAALERKLRVIPVLVGGASLPEASEVPDSLRALIGRQAVAVREDPDFHRDMNRLIRALGGRRARVRWAVGIGLIAAIVVIIGVLGDLLTKKSPWRTSQPPSGQSEVVKQTLHGQILDESTRQPLEGVRVFLPEYELEVLSTARGTYRFEVPAPPSALVKLQAAKDGYQPVNQDLTVGTGNLDTLYMRKAR